METNLSSQKALSSAPKWALVVWGLILMGAVGAAGYFAAVKKYDVGPEPTPTLPAGCYYHEVQCIKAPCYPEIVCPSPNRSCQPRPACLDSEPRCLLPEPAEGWCSESTGTTYTNDQYGFEMIFPSTWNDYTDSEKQWIGTDVTTGAKTEQGPLVTLYHPNYIVNGIHIPIMIFTQQQWAKVQSETLSTSAAPIPPTKIGQNNRFVFALTPRYQNYFTSETGFVEVEAIIETFKAF